MIYEGIQGIVIFLIFATTLVLMSIVKILVEKRLGRNSFDGTISSILRSYLTEMSSNQSNRAFVHIIFFLGIFLMAIPLMPERESAALFVLTLIWSVTHFYFIGSDEFLKSEKLLYLFIITMNFILGAALAVSGEASYQMIGWVIALVSLNMLRTTGINVYSYAVAQRINVARLPYYLSMYWLFITIVKSVLPAISIEMVYLGAGIILVVCGGILETLAAPSIENRLFQENNKKIQIIMTLTSIVVLVTLGWGHHHG